MTKTYDLPEAPEAPVARDDVEAALQAADAQTLYRLLREKEKKMSALVTGFGVMIEDGKTQPRPNDEALQQVAVAALTSMQAVALAAITLAEHTLDKVSDA